MMLAYLHTDCLKETAGLKYYENIILKFVEDDYACYYFA